MSKPTEAQMVKLKWLQFGGRVESTKVHSQTRAKMLREGWVTDNGDDFRLTDAGRAILEKYGGGKHN